MQGIRQNITRFKQKRTFRNRFYSWPVLIILAIILIFMVREVWDMYAKVRTSDARLLQAQTELRELEERRSELTQKIAYLETDTGIEEHLRREYDVAKEGEQVIVILDNDDEVEVIDLEKKGFWQKVGEWFK